MIDAAEVAPSQSPIPAGTKITLSISDQPPLGTVAVS